MKGMEDECASPATVDEPAGAAERAAASGPRRTSEAPVADSWRDALLRLSLELPLDATQEEITHLFLTRLVPLLPNLALGARVLQSSHAEPLIVVRMPAGFAKAPASEGARLFPALAEDIFTLPDLSPSSTLHVACFPEQGELTPFHAQVAERAARVLSAGLVRARAYQHQSGETRSVWELKAQLVQAEKLASLGQIVAGVVHELNNPLTSILAYAQHLTRRLQATTGFDTSDLERLRRISEAAERVLKFSRDLVAYARPIVETPGPVHLLEVVRKAQVFCDHEFSVHGVYVETRIASELPKLLGVTGQLTQVFVNLFINAVHAMRVGGTLTVEATLDNSCKALLVEVRDSGSGIPSEQLAQIFEPFFTTKPDGQGTGLGLSIVRDILEAHGGSIAVQSQLHTGTTFQLVLPVAERAPSPSQKP